MGLAPQDIPADILPEIFVRLRSVNSVFRCALVCKEWRRLILSPVSFRRRLFPPLLLGFIENLKLVSVNPWGIKFVPTTSYPAFSFSFSSIRVSRYSIFTLAGCRNGYVVLQQFSISGMVFIVCNPSTGQLLTLPPFRSDVKDFVGPPSMVLLTDVDVDDDQIPPSAFRLHALFCESGKIGVRAFFSGDESWTREVYSDIPIERILLTIKPPVVVDGVVYWLQSDGAILAMSVETSQLYLIKIPRGIYDRLSMSGLLASTEEKRLCHVVLDGFLLSIWIHHREGSGGNARWVLREKIDLSKQIRPRAAIVSELVRQRGELIGFGERSGAVILDIRGVIFSFHIRSGRVEELYRRAGHSSCFIGRSIIYPYEMAWPPHS